MEAKMNVKIQGEASPNRIALSIIKAYLKLYPQSNLSDLRNAFPNSLNPVCASKQIFMTEKDINKHLQNGEAWYATGRGYFLKENEWLIMPDGERVGFVSMWTKPSLERLIAKAKGYGIAVLKVDEHSSFLDRIKPNKDKLSIIIEDLKKKADTLAHTTSNMVGDVKRIIGDRISTIKSNLPENDLQKPNDGKISSNIDNHSDLKEETRTYKIRFKCMANRLIFVPASDEILDACTDDEKSNDEIWDEFYDEWNCDDDLRDEIEDLTIYSAHKDGYLQVENEDGAVVYEKREGEDDSSEISRDDTFLNHLTIDENAESGLLWIKDKLKNNHKGIYLYRDAVVPSCVFEVVIETTGDFDISKLKRVRCPEFEHEDVFVFNSFSYKGETYSAELLDCDFEKYWETDLVRVSDNGIESIEVDEIYDSNNEESTKSPSQDSCSNNRMAADITTSEEAGIKTYHLRIECDQFYRVDVLNLPDAKDEEIEEGFDNEEYWTDIVGETQVLYTRVEDLRNAVNDDDYSWFDDDEDSVRIITDMIGDSTIWDGNYYPDAEGDFKIVVMDENDEEIETVEGEEISAICFEDSYKYKDSLDENDEDSYPLKKDYLDKNHIDAGSVCDDFAVCKNGWAWVNIQKSESDYSNYPVYELQLNEEFDAEKLSVKKVLMEEPLNGCMSIEAITSILYDGIEISEQIEYFCSAGDEGTNFFTKREPSKTLPTVVYDFTNKEKA